MPNASLLKEFESLIGKENVLTSEADRQCYSYDATPHAPVVPELVLRPTRVEELGPLIKRCYSAGFHIVVRGIRHQSVRRCGAGQQREQWSF